MTYPEAVRYLESFVNYEKLPAFPYKESLRLERIKGFLDALGNPQDKLRVLHVAGTKGKGSTCAFIAYILREAGFRVGLYTSPHLTEFRERIRILEKQETREQGSGRDFYGMITEADLAGNVEKLKPAVEEYNKISEYGALTFFEITTALAFTYFKERNIDFAVLETGLGGRLDATSAADALVCALTPISLEHTDKLGSTLREIATEKAGIIKGHKLTVVSAPQEKEAMQVIRGKCEEAGARLLEIGKDIFYEKARQGFSVMGSFQEYPNLETKLLGRHQMVNTAVAIGVIESLRAYDIFVNAKAVREGIAETVWPGRCEVISHKPLIVLDGAQNAASAAVLKEAVRENFNFKRLVLVLGVFQDKDIPGVCSILRDMADEVVLTKADNPRAVPPSLLSPYFEGKRIHLTESVKQARDVSQDLAEKEDMILVTGSLYVVGEFRDACNPS